MGRRPSKSRLRRLGKVPNGVNIDSIPSHLLGSLEDSLALPNFGQVQFNDSYAAISGYPDSIGLAKNGTVFYYCTGSHYRLVPSVLESGWTAFTVFSIALAGC